MHSSLNSRGFKSESHGITRLLANKSLYRYSPDRENFGPTTKTRMAKTKQTIPVLKETSSTPAAKHFLSIRGARVHNLKNISIDIPRNRLVVITLSLIHISEPTRLG